MQTPEEVWDQIEDSLDSATQWGISNDQRKRAAALIRERDAEVRADERAKVLAGFEWQFALRDERGRTRGLLASLTEADVPSTLTPMRRLVSPWEPTP